MVAQNPPTRCPLHLSRRGFLRGLGASAVALQLSAFETASSLLGEQPAPKGK